MDHGMFLLTSGVFLLVLLGVVLLVTAITGRDPDVYALEIGHRWNRRKRQVHHPPEPHPVRNGAIGVALIVIAVLVVVLAPV